MEAFDTQLFLAIAVIVVSALAFGWHVVLSVRDARRVMSGPVSQRLLLALGMAAGIGIFYVVRR